MNFFRRRVKRDENGAALVLCIAFMVVVGGIGSSLLPAITSGVHGHTVLEVARNREYAADGAVEQAIATVRNNMTAGTAIPDPCLPAPPNYLLNAVTIQVGCAYVATLASGHYQRNVIFTAKCAVLSPQPSQCPDPSAVIIRAQVNFQSPSLLSDTTISVTRTFVQSWSVNA